MDFNDFNLPTEKIETKKFSFFPEEACQTDSCNHPHSHHNHGCSCHNAEESFSVRTKVAMIFSSLALLILAILLENLSFSPFISLPVFILAYITVGINAFIGLVNEIKEGNIFSEYLLMAVATLGAMLIGEFSEAVAVMIFHTVGTLTEHFSLSKSKNSVRSLLDSRPKTVEAYINEKWQETPISQIKVGNIFRVTAGQMLPLDGIVVKGNASVDTSSVNGESLPLNLSEGKNAFSGYINLDGVLEIKATTEEKNSTLSEIIRLVEEGAENKSNSEKTLSSFAKYYTPIVILLAFIVATVCPLIFGNFQYFFKVSLLFLVASCPCSLLIGIPLSFYCGIGALAKKGILVKGGSHIERSAKLKAIAFDKTGTLTDGNFGILKIESQNEQELLNLLAHAEHFSNHPLATVFKNRSVDENLISDFKEISGKGVSLLYDKKPLLAGSRAFLEEFGIETPNPSQKGSMIFVAFNQRFVGYLLLGDILRADAEETLSKIKKCGIRKTMLISGDKPENVLPLAEALSLDMAFSSQLPNEKVEKLEMLGLEYCGNVAFVGDGINDAPVLAKSPLSFAIAGEGKDIAASSADVVLLNGKLRGVAKTVSFSKRVMRLVHFDIIFSLIAKFGVMLWGFFGCPMYMAVFADVGLVILFPLLAFSLFLNK